MISKVATTCHPHPAFNTGLLLLYEVDLGGPILELTPDHFEIEHHDERMDHDRVWLSKGEHTTWKGPDPTMPIEETESTVFWKKPGPAAWAKEQGCKATIHKGYYTPERWADASCIHKSLAGVLMVRCGIRSTKQ